MQRFLAQDIFEDGQTADEGQPDRAESDAGDNEVSDTDDAEMPARTGSLGMGYKRPGTPDSLQQLLDGWSDDSSDDDPGADASPARGEPARPKRTRDETEPAGVGSSRWQPMKGQPAKKKAKAPPAKGTLVDAPLDILPLRYKMPVLPTLHG